MLAALALALFAGAPTSWACTCGVERWSVKTGTDPDAGLVDLTRSTAATISYLASLPAPASLPDNGRVQPTETTQFLLDVLLTAYKREDDCDYHLIIDDTAGSMMIVEIPDPVCVDSTSLFATAIAHARAQFDARLVATTSWKMPSPPIPILVQGVGFFDFLHGQTGAAPNGIELHPVTDITFDPPPCGDVSGDRVVNIGDALLVAQFEVGLRQCGLTPFSHPVVCDVNGDGACNIGDALHIAQCDVGLVSCAFACVPFICPSMTSTTWEQPQPRRPQRRRRLSRVVRACSRRSVTRTIGVRHGHLLPVAHGHADRHAQRDPARRPGSRASGRCTWRCRGVPFRAPAR